MKNLFLGAIFLLAPSGLSFAQPSPTAALPSGLTVVTYADLMPGGADAGRALLIREIQQERTQPDCVAAELIQEEGRPNHFMLVESWRDSAALESWHASSDYRQFRAELQPALGSPFDERRGARIAP
jgi:quinol monooxygenase YgiN